MSGLGGDSMEFEKLGKEDIRSMYDLMEEAFPEEERRKYEKHKQLYENGCFEIFGKKDETGKVIAVMSIWNLEDVRYAEHLAVDPCLRGQKIGENLLQWVLKKNDLPLVLEVELPENEIAKRRIGFYQRQGLYYNEYPYLQPPLQEGHGMLPLRLMTYPEKIDEKTYHRYEKQIHQKVYFYNA